MLLGYDELLQVVKSGFITRVDESNINGSSIDVTLGNTILTEMDRPAKNKPWRVSLRSRKPLPMRTHNISGKKFILQPGQFILAHTEQIFELPDWLSAEFKLKSSAARIGLEQLDACWCFTGNTKIPLLSGKSVSIEKLVGKRPWVYSLDDKGEIVPGRASEVWQTGKVKHLVKITLDNGESFQCTPDHKIMLRNGEYIKASKLKANTALMPFYQKLDSDGHQSVYSPSTVLKGKWQNLKGAWKKTHSLVDRALNGPLPKGYDVHHNDEIKTNNRPKNLKRMLSSEHVAYHGCKRFKSKELRELASKRATSRNKRAWLDVEYRKKMTERNRRNSAYTNNKRWGTPIPKEYLNHKVANVEHIHYKKAVAVYDMSIPKWHNFAIDSGIFVHNCDPGWHNSVLTLELKNMTKNCSIELHEGDHIGQMVFYKGSSDVPADKSYRVRGRYNNDKLPQGPRNFFDRKVS